MFILDTLRDFYFPTGVSDHEPFLNGLNLVTVHALLLLSGAFLKSVIHRSVKSNACHTLVASFIIYTIPFTFLFGGYQVGPQPPVEICTIQAAFLFAGPPFASWAITCYQAETCLYLYANKPNQKNKLRSYFKFVAVWPWLVFASTFIWFIMSLRDYSDVVRHPSGIYCYAPSPTQFITPGMVTFTSCAVHVILEFVFIILGGEKVRRSEWERLARAAKAKTKLTELEKFEYPSSTMTHSTLDLLNFYAVVYVTGYLVIPDHYFEEYYWLEMAAAHLPHLVTMLMALTLVMDKTRRTPVPLRPASSETEKPQRPLSKKDRKQLQKKWARSVVESMMAQDDAASVSKLLRRTSWGRFSSIRSD